MTNLLADSASDRPGFESQPHHLLTLGKLLKLSEPQFPNLYSGTNDSPHLVILLCRFRAGAWMKRLSLLLFSVTRSAGVWGGAQPTPASQTSWKGEPSITVLGPPRGLRSASRYRLTTPVSDICHSQRWVLVSKNQSHPGVNSHFVCTHLACLMSLCCGLFRSLEKSA